MDVNTTQQLAGLANPSSSSNPQGSSALGKDEFVKLLMAQMAHQDPLSPMDGSAFVAQLAQFANVEQLQTANSTLESLLVSQSSNAQLGAASLVGKDVVFKADSVDLVAGQDSTIAARLSAAATNVTVTIKNSEGKTVRTLQVGAHGEGTFDTTWDGRDDKGNLLAPGKYSVAVAAADVSGNSVPIEQRVRARIEGVSFQNGYPELMVGSLRIKLADVAEVADPNPTVPH